MACDEINRLEKWQAQNERDAALEENKRLREALESIAKAELKHIYALPASHAWVMREVARRVLKGGRHR